MNLFKGITEKIISNKVKIIKVAIAISTIAIATIQVVQYDNWNRYTTEMLEIGKTSLIISKPNIVQVQNDINGNSELQNQAQNSNQSEAQSLAGNDFSSDPLPKSIVQKITGKSFTENKDIKLNQLRYLKVLYYGFDGKTHMGELIVNVKVADEVLDIFKELYISKFPIEKIRLIDEYGASDDKSMEANNTSAFCYREITGGGQVSLHGLGLAIDINPIQNPYVKSEESGKITILPKLGQKYFDREKSAKLQGVIVKDDACYKAFTSRGWKWGGDWKNPKDYQHFYKEN